MPNSQKNNEVITELDLYITLSGRIAFLNAVHERDSGLKAFSGYVYDLIRGKSVPRPMEWLSCGECVSSEDDGDQIVHRA
jgi:hypothetical protein